MTDDIVRALSADLAPVSQWRVSRRLFIGAGAGAVLSAALMLAVLGLRPDIQHAIGTGMFWSKQAYPLVLAIIAGFAADRLARPAATARASIAWLAVPVLLIAGAAMVELALAAPDTRLPAIMGQSARVCSWRILLFAVFPLVGLVWAMRGLAPTRLREAGATAGLSAGGAGAFIYALHCTENAVPFLAVWYSLGVAAPAFGGYLLGPLLLRWR